MVAAVAEAMMVIESFDLPLLSIAVNVRDDQFISVDFSRVLWMKVRKL